MYKLILLLVLLISSLVVQASEIDSFSKTYWNFLMNSYPEWASMVGYNVRNDRWSSYTETNFLKQKLRASQLLNQLKSIKTANKKDLINKKLLELQLKELVTARELNLEYLDLSTMDGIQRTIQQTLSIQPLLNEKDYQDYFLRLQKIPTLVDEYIEMLYRGLKQDIVPPKLIVKDIPRQIALLADEEKSLENNPLFEGFFKFPSTFSIEQRKNYQKQLELIFKKDVVGALKKFKNFLDETYIPKCRETIAVSDIKNGKKIYEYYIQSHTTTKLNADEIHKIGLSEVARIKSEMLNLIAASGFKGSFQEFLNFLRTDSRFFFNSGDELLREYRNIAKKIDPELVKLFLVLPKLPYGIKAVPASTERTQPTAYYMAGSLKNGRGGYFVANTFDLKMRPKWEMEALTLHEAVPGHHLQISLAQEQEDLPDFRRHSGFTAYVEGWGLYAESLGSDLGMYTDIYSKFGQLTYEMWRAIRLVVDTGIHAKNWTREQAIQYFKENSAKTEHDIEVEVDRYIGTPGQALAYKIGEMKIKELKKLVQQHEKNKFDIRKFHYSILKNGALPLSILEQEVKSEYKIK